MELLNLRLIRLISTGERKEIRKILDIMLSAEEMTDMQMLDVAWGLNALGESRPAFEYLMATDSAAVRNAEKYLAIKSEILDSLGRYRESREVYEGFLKQFMLNQDTLIRSEVSNVESKYGMQMELARSNYEKSRLLFLVLLIAVLAGGLGIYLNSRRKVEANRRIA